MSIREASITSCSFCVVTDLVPAEAEGRCAARFGAINGGDSAVAEGGRYRQVLLLSTVDRVAVVSALEGPLAAVVELGDEDDASGDWSAAPVPENGFYLSLTTSTAYGFQVAAVISGALIARGVVSADQRSVVELCLHEAVANALVHGNLGIASSAKDHPEGYRMFSQLVTERLREPARARRRVDVFVRWCGRILDISVVDQGEGFEEAVLPVEVAGNSRSGRGFLFMRALASRVVITDGGRCTTLRFEL